MRFRITSRLLGLLALLALASAAMAASHPGVAAFAQAVIRSGDAGGRAFAVLDKPSATLAVFDAQGRPIGQTHVLLGEAVGDVAPPDIGSRPLSKIRKSEKSPPPAGT